MHRIQQKIDNDRKNAWQNVRDDEYEEIILYAVDTWTT